jgi:hypothetical protein
MEKTLLQHEMLLPQGGRKILLVTDPPNILANFC